MMTAQERVVSLHARMEALRRTQERRKTVALGTVCHGLVICLLMLVFGGATHSAGTAGLYSGSILMFENAGGYVLTAVVAFIVGVTVTAAIIWNRKRIGTNFSTRTVFSQNAEITQPGKDISHGGEER